MQKPKVRIYDILTEEEKRLIEECKENIIRSRTIYDVNYYQKCAEQIMDCAKKRFLSKKGTLENKRSLDS